MQSRNTKLEEISTKLVRTNSSNPDFKSLVAFLDDYLGIVDGDQHAYYDKFNQVDSLQKVIVCYENDEAVSCGALRDMGSGVMEVKRMFTRPEFRGKGYAKQVLAELEKWAAESGAATCILETGRTMTDAIGFYKANGYVVIPNYGPYVGIENSVCFEKILKKH